MNGVPMTVNPILNRVAIQEWGQDGVICTDAGALWNMLTHHHCYQDIDAGRGRGGSGGHQPVPR
jgi:beta-glucosidase